MDRNDNLVLALYSKDLCLNGTQETNLFPLKIAKNIH